RRLALYLLAWIPVSALLAYLLSVSSSLPWIEAFALAFPLSMIYAFVCLSSFYLCRYTPLGTTDFSRLVVMQLAAALVETGLWILLARFLAYELSEDLIPNLYPRFPVFVPILLGGGVLFYLLSVAFYYAYLATEASREAEARALQASLLARDAELKALKAQVNPHFLFNSLNSISALTSSDAARAREMCILLGDFLRRTLGLGEKTVIPIQEELSLIHSFLAVEKIRFGARLGMTENVEKDSLECQIPPLLLQPLVENAVVHGVANLIEGGSIRLDIRCTDGIVSIDVENNFDPESPSRPRNGVGLANVRQRLEARYGNRASFAVKSEKDQFRVSLTLPAEKETAAP
ncbi:MAG: histidine kinase, partial [Acidobacteria bacterium]|nr:histidine kinase [Acidobacteriota bacterium]